MTRVGYAECMACDAPAVKSTVHGRERAVLCAYHAELLGKHKSFAAAFKAAGADKTKKSGGNSNG